VTVPPNHYSRWLQSLPLFAVRSAAMAWNSIKPVVAGLAILALAGTAKAEMLISTQEAGLPESPFNERGAFPGPKIVLVAPSQGTTPVKAPMRLQIKFEQRGAKIDLDSLRITYIKLQPVDLTERVRPFVSQDGVDFKNAEVPPGTHKIRVEVRDVDGVPGGADVILKVGQ
jgi:hypothetical protein